jgi:hypothetical protein
MTASGLQRVLDSVIHDEYIGSGFMQPHSIYPLTHKQEENAYAYK